MASTPIKSDMKREFPLRAPLFQTGLILLGLSVLMYLIFAPLMLFIPQNRPDAPWVALLLSPFPLMGFYLAWHHMGRVSVTEDAITLYRLWWSKTICYANVTAVKEKDSGMPGGLVLRSDKKRIRISRFIRHYPELYDLLRQRIDVMQQKEQTAFPFEIQVRRRYILQNGIMVVILFGMMIGLSLLMRFQSDVTLGAIAFLNGAWLLVVIPILYAALEVKQPVRMRFTSETIEARYLTGKKRRWDAAELNKVKLEARQVRVRTSGGTRARGVRYPVRFCFDGSQELILTESRIGAFGYAPERLVSILKRLYAI